MISEPKLLLRPHITDPLDSCDNKAFEDHDAACEREGRPFSALKDVTCFRETGYGREQGVENGFNRTQRPGAYCYGGYTP
jgi:hypothetical protein